MEMKLHREEMDVYGYTILGKMLTEKQVNFFRNNLLEKKEEQIKKYGKEKLAQYGELEMWAALIKIVKSRLGYNVRTYTDPDEMLTDNRKWKSGNYDTSNIKIK